MGEIKLFSEIINNISSFNEENTIYIEDSSSPSPRSAATVIKSDQSKIVLGKSDYIYVLEAFLAKEVIEDWEKDYGKLSLEEKCALVIYYSLTDAYPQKKAQLKFPLEFN
jgi:hypothetical protein